MVPYPLTCFLSLGERRPVLRLRERMMGCLQVFGVRRRIRLRRERTNDIGNLKTPRAVFPLLKGEGEGEGVRNCMLLPTVKIAQRNFSEGNGF